TRRLDARAGRVDNLGPHARETPTEKPREMVTKEELLERLHAAGARILRLQFTDITGVIKSVEVPASQFSKALDGEMLFDGSSIEGFVRIEESDMILKPDFSTLAIFPWAEDEDRVARLICDVHTADGKPFEGDPRRVLRRQIEA